jgi:hypothetical protein
LPFLEQEEEEEITVHVTPIEPEEEPEMCVTEDG